jgi:nicotinate-nucleotide pyrophosphorylase (carboxylating)
MQYLLNNFAMKEHIQQALKEDIGFGDITTDSIYDENHTAKAVINSRSEGIVCGIDVVKAVYELLDPSIKFTVLLKDGDKISKGQDIAIVEGSCRVILTGERVALNYIQRMSAIATLANKYQEAVKPYKAKVVDTRKTTPGFRIFEKYAVIIGGANLHRFNLSDCIMLKDNHIKYVGSIKSAVEKVRQKASHVHKIEVETETLEQVKEALDAGVDIIMLDNMSMDEMKEAVKLINNKAIVEASGNVTLENINEIASTGVDIISTSAMQAKAGTLDIGLDIIK